MRYRKSTVFYQRKAITDPVSKSLVLVVDRDDDFGNKGNVVTPVIGLDAAVAAAIDLGVADPEDSDVNGLLAGIHLYKEMKEEGRDVEIALICGDKKVGHRSDEALQKELQTVIETVHPDNAVLVSDGAEDEYVYPIITAYVKIMSVKKVYVKQTPGIEGFFYIVSKTLSDPAKKKRFLAPIGAILTVIALVYLIVDISAYSVTESTSYLFDMTAPLVLLFIGLLILNYAYDSIDAILDYFNQWAQQVKDNSISAAFTLLSIILFVVGFIIAIYSVKDYLGNSILYIALVFLSSLLWPIEFSVLFNRLGKIMNGLVESHAFEYNILTGIIMQFGIGFILQAIIDFMTGYLGYFSIDTTITLLELAAGIFMMIMSSGIAILFRRMYAAKNKEAVANEA